MALPMAEKLDISPTLSWEQRKWQIKVLVSVYFAYVGFYLTRKVFTIVKKSIATDFDVGLNAVAHIWTAYLVAYALGMLVNSYVGRQRGARFLLLGGLGLSVVFNVIFGFANSYYTFVVFMFCNGLIQACGWPGCVGGVAEWLHRKERGTLMGILSTNYLVGNIVVKSVGGYLLGAYTWRYSFFGCTLLAFGIWLLIFFWQRNRPEDVGLAPIIDEEDPDRAIKASNEINITFQDYLGVLMNPLVMLMGASYFCLKFMRYALDSWLPTFLALQGFAEDKAAYYSQIFDIAGFFGIVLSGWALDRVFRGRWTALCLAMGVGMIVGYIGMVTYGANPYLMVLSSGVVGFMLYGPDTLLCGAASMAVAGERNAIIVAALVNGIGSIGPIVQEEVIGLFMRDDIPKAQGVLNASYLGLAMSVLFMVVMFVLFLRLHRKPAQAA